MRRGLAFLTCLTFGCSSTPAVQNAPDSGSPTPTCVDEFASKETVSVEGVFGTLEGTLRLPDRCGPVPLVIVLSGSGSSDRDGNAGDRKYVIDSYKMFAEELTRQAKVATLCYDDEGIGGSASALPKAPEDFRFDDEVADAVRVVRHSKGDARISRVFLAGHSLGSLTAMLAAQQEPIAGIVSLAGAGRNTSEILHEQLATKVSADTLKILDDALAKMRAGQLAGPLPSPLDQLFPEVGQPYTISLLKYDPTVEFAKLKTPAIVIQGRVDIQISVHDAELLHAARPDTDLVLLDTMSHVLKEATSSSASQNKAYSDPTVPLATGLIDAVRPFVRQGME